MKKQKTSLRLKILLGLLLLSIIAWPVYFLTSPKNIFDLAGSVLEQHPKYFSSLNGLPVPTAEQQEPQIIGVMIDNHPDAYPQYCLGAPGSVVYEAPAEGVTTRFMQVMSVDNILPKIGPVRSARLYFMDWLAEYGDALYMHCGGAPNALEGLAMRKTFDANEFYWGSYYWRDSGKTAPHNLYTSTEKIKLLLSSDRGRARIELRGEESAKMLKLSGNWKFKADQISETGTSAHELASGLTIKYYAGYTVGWRYTVDGNLAQYERLVNGDYHKSICGAADAATIVAQNVIIQFVQMETVDELGRKEIQTVGGGAAYIFNRGRLVRGNWKKNEIYGRTVFYDKTGVEIVLEPGSTWVEVVPEEIKVEITS